MDDTVPARTPGASWSGVASVLVVVIAAAAVAVTVARLFFGVDFIDEAFYAATAYRFAMGARPFFSDLDIHQTAGWLVSPYVRLHLAVFGDTTGIMLSLRLLWAAMSLGAAAMSYRLMRRLVDWRAALLGSAAAFSLIPYMIPAPSFNTLPIIFGSLAVSLVGIGLLERSGPARFLLAGAALGMASVAHPGFAVVALVLAAGVWLADRTWRRPVWMLAGGGAVAAVVLLLLSPYFSGIPNVLAIARDAAPILDWGGAGGGVGAKAVNIAARILVMAGTWPAVWIAIVVGAVQSLRKRVPAWLLVALVACIPVGAQPSDLATLMLATQLMLLGSILGLTALGPARPAEAAEAVTPLEAPEADAEAVTPLEAPEAPTPPPATPDAVDATPDPLPRRVLLLTIAAGLTAAAMFALVSSRGADYLGFGAAVTLGPFVSIVLARLGDAISASTVRLGAGTRAVTASSVAPMGIALAGCLLLGTFGILNANSAYRDEIPPALTTMVRRGPQAGLLTTAPMAGDSEALWDAMQRLTTSSTRVLAYHGLPAAYLYTSGTPAIAQLWLANWDAMGDAPLTRDAIAEMSQPGHAPDIVVQNLGFPSLWVLSFNAVARYDPARDAVEAYVEKGYRQVVRGDRWRILAPVSAR